MMTKEDVLQYVEEEGVKFIRLAFFDLFGVQKNISIMPIALRRAFEKGITIDASQVFPSGALEQSDLILHPDPSTMINLPWRSMENGVIHMICDLYTPQGEPFLPDPRKMLKNAIGRAQKAGLDVLMAAKFQFYLFERDEKGRPTSTPFDQGGYMDVAPKDCGENIRREICLILEEMGFDPHKSFHQQGPGQNEIDFHFSDPMAAADEASIFKWVVETCAANNGLYADFSPSPLPGQPGSAMHVQIRFLNSSKEDQEFFLAGLLENLPALQLLFCPGKTSHNRLEHPSSPSEAGWSGTNRNVMVRIPPLARDVLEVRLADSNANPYLVFALILECGLQGMENALSLDAISAHQPLALPLSFEQAKEKLLQASALKTCLHPDVVAAYLEVLEGSC